MPRFNLQSLLSSRDVEAVKHPTLKNAMQAIYHMAMMGEDVLSALQENIQDIGHIQFADNQDIEPSRFRQARLHYYFQMVTFQCLFRLYRCRIPPKSGVKSIIYGRDNRFLNQSG